MQIFGIIEPPEGDNNSPMLCDRQPQDSIGIPDGAVPTISAGIRHESVSLVKVLIS